MDFSALIALLAGQYPIVTTIASILGALVVIGQVVVTLTPSPSDNEKYDKIMEIPFLGLFLKALASFAPIQKK